MRNGNLATMMFRNIVLLASFMLTQCLGSATAGVCDLERNTNLPFCNSALSIDARVADLLTRISYEEMGMLLVHNASEANSVVGLEDYNWWNEALHGVAHSPGVIWEPPTEFSTSFPQVLHVASSFSRELFLRVATAIGNEARAFHNAGHAGLTFWGPSVNIYRDPRWGRGHETPGEDPYLTGQYSIEYVRGIQGYGAEQEANNGFLKTSACCKHFAAHSSETDRTFFDSVVTEQDMTDTYLPAFRTCVEQGEASCIMCSFNSINGLPMCAHKELLTNTLRDTWGFDGYVTSDCGGVNLVQTAHNYTTTKAELMTAVLDAGLDLECEQGFSRHPQVFANYLTDSIDDGGVPLDLVHKALGHLLRTQMRLGIFEKNATRPYMDLQPPLIESPEHKALALEAARQSIVLLKNEAGLLPLNKDIFNAQNKLALIGPHLNASRWFLANYRGFPSHIDTPLEAILTNYVADTEYAFGCAITPVNDTDDMQEAVNLAAALSTKQVVLFVGLNLDVEEEDNDRANITLTGRQNQLIRSIIALSRDPIVLAVVAGGAVDLTEYQNDPRVGAIVFVGYIGQAGGLAAADVIFGTYNPSGRLTQTFYPTEFLSQVPIGDMFMRPNTTTGSLGRTYRFYQGQPVYEFGYGLSYTTFNYAWINQKANDVVTLTLDSITKDQDCSLTLSILLTNRGEGNRSADHSVLWFLSPPDAGNLGRPLKSLVEFERVENLQPNEQRRLDVCLTPNQFMLANERGEFELVAGLWTLAVGDILILLDVSPTN